MKTNMKIIGRVEGPYGTIPVGTEFVLTDEGFHNKELKLTFDKEAVKANYDVFLTY